MKPTSLITFQPGVSFALAAALLFGASTPVAKILLGQVEPMQLAGLLYFGSGSGLAIWWWLRFRFQRGGSQEASLQLSDLPWLAGAILAGGIIGPVLLMVGLALTPASSASLLLNLEGVFTALLARTPTVIHIHIRRCSIPTLTIRTFIIAMAISWIYLASPNHPGRPAL